ncbi:hypothetical protein V5P93_003947 [Actinokineospora auranticolor]|uniref:Uncharacterized protein n=1 Tax=Actinokineospora auranticolor TaxID=155976 RepID=A0A2S6GLX1_9PSEU|nr:hypothetical protein [Actinokineospora auranticolor]PPK66228.1 hypothetical protein CLV40_111192 [Actinokineospora auranticolor]
MLAADLDAGFGATTTVAEALAAWQVSRTAVGVAGLAEAVVGAPTTVNAQESAEAAAMDTKYPDTERRGYGSCRSAARIKLETWSCSVFGHVGFQSLATGTLFS